MVRAEEWGEDFAAAGACTSEVADAVVIRFGDGIFYWYDAQEFVVNWWQNIPAHINPRIFAIGSFELRYYGLMYLVAFAVVYWLATSRLRKEPFDYTKELLQNYFVWAILGVMIGGRLGYVLFYDLKYFLANPLEIILPFEFSNGFRFTGISGMSYHGGVIGVLISTVVFCRKYNVGFWSFGDFLAPAIPLGYTFGRLGNFINGELYGRATSLPWGMYFPNDPTGQLRHPSQLYEAFFEGILLFVILWSVRKQKILEGLFIALYLIGYGLIRFIIEFVRQPDAHLGKIFGPFSMGQVLCLFMILGGVVIIIVRRRRSVRASPPGMD